VQHRDSLADWQQACGLLEVRDNGAALFESWFSSAAAASYSSPEGAVGSPSRIAFLHTADELSMHDTRWYGGTGESGTELPLVIRHYYDEHRMPPRGLWQVNGPGHLYPCFSEVASVCSNPQTSFMEKVAACLPDLPRTSQRTHHVCFMGLIHHSRAVMLRALEAFQRSSPWLRVYTVKSATFGGGLAREHLADALMDCQFGLVPCGNNPETHRLWEYLMYGVIPVIEHCPEVSGRAFPPHKNYLQYLTREFWNGSSAWLTISNWSDLPGLLLPHLEPLRNHHPSRPGGARAADPREGGGGGGGGGSMGGGVASGGGGACDSETSAASGETSAERGASNTSEEEAETGSPPIQPSLPRRVQSALEALDARQQRLVEWWWCYSKRMAHTMSTTLGDLFQASAYQRGSSGPGLCVNQHTGPQSGTCAHLNL